MQTYTIDAQGKKLGRVASEAARLLRGKGSVNFTPNELPSAAVLILNASGLSFSEKKIAQTQLTRYSGYPGGLKRRSVRDTITRRGVPELLRQTILGMLPRNRLRSRIIKHLTVRE
ncbi:MAG: large subunit ribosomal protein L13 [Parcubacteria group bacterium Greene0416_79]|nr:MAG: large subunit ribosomal protein L13 [Parcubacteria group bacterium Greene0416_79]